MDFNARPKNVGREAYCSAPPFASPPRPSRDQEARRVREPLWIDDARAPEAQGMECTASDIKPDIKPDLAASTSHNVTRPTAASSSSSSEAQHRVPSRMVRWGTPVITPQPPPMRPRNTFLRMQRRAAVEAARFDQELGILPAPRRTEVAVVRVTESSSSESDTCDLSDLSELSVSEDDESDFYDNCLNVSSRGDVDGPASTSRNSGRNVGLLRQMASSP